LDDKQVARYWDENAPGWIESVRAGYDVYREYVNNPAFFGMLPDPSGKHTLDVGCGEGYNTRKLADLGASLVGVDVSMVMIDAACEHERQEPRGIHYHVTNGNDMSMLADRSFDWVVSTMAIMDMADYEGCVREVSRVIKPGGLFQFSILHPCFMTRLWEWVINEHGERVGVVAGNYFGLQSEGPSRDIDEWFFSKAPEHMKREYGKFRMPRFYRTLSEYFATLDDSGFVVRRIAEPYPDERTIKECPHVADARIIPHFLIFQCFKSEET
jgi:ubiquinone/menaquinone biosynthesis C-methylase UbiE